MVLRARTEFCDIYHLKQRSELYITVVLRSNLSLLIIRGTEVLLLDYVMHRMTMIFKGNLVPFSTKSRVRILSVFCGQVADLASDAMLQQ